MSNPGARYALKTIGYLIKEARIKKRDIAVDLFKRLVFKKSEGIAGIIRRHAINQPDKVAVVWGENTRSYRDLFQRSQALAQYFTTSGMKPGDKLALVTPNAPEIPEVWTATSLAKLSIIPVNWRLKAGELRYIFEDAECKDVVCHEEVAEEIKKSGIAFRNFIVMGGSRGNGVPYEDALSMGEAGRWEPPAGDSEVLVYTSGTTGQPKGARRSISPRTTMLFVSSVAYEFGLRGDDVHLVVCPLYHSAPLFFMQLNLVLGATLVILPRFRSEMFFEAVTKHNVTSTFIVPFMLIDVLDSLERDEKLLSGNVLRCVICAAAPLSPHLKEKFVEKVGPVLYEFYGATETGINTVLRPCDIPKKSHSVGKVFPYNAIKILDENKRELPPGEAGEIFITTPFLMNGYHKREEETREAMAGEYLSVGDVGTLDEEGYLYIMDRKKDMIISGGVNIYPAEIENALLKHHAVKAAAVIGVPDERWGERVKAFIVLREGKTVSQEELEKFLRNHIAGYKIPREWAFVTELPMTPSGKILKRELRNL